MATRLIKYSYNIFYKAIAFSLAVMFGVLIILTTIDTINKTDMLVPLNQTNYYQSSYFVNDFSSVVNDIMTLAKDYKNEEYIKSGGTITVEKVKNAERALYQEFENEYVNDYTSNSEMRNLTYEKRYEQFKVKYKDKIAKINNQIIDNDIMAYHNLLKRINGYKGLFYYIHDGQYEITNNTNNSEDFYKTQQGYLVIKNGVWDYNIDSYSKYRSYSYSYDRRVQNSERITSSDKIFIAITKDFVGDKDIKWSDAVVYSHTFYRMILYLGIGFLIAICFLILAAGRRQDDDDVHLLGIDKLYVDINICIIISIMFLVAFFLSQTYTSIDYSMLLPILVIVCSTLLGLLLSLVRHIKSKTFFRNTLVFRFLYGIYKFFKRITHTDSLTKKVAGIILIYSGLCAVSIIFFPITIALIVIAILFTHKKAAQFDMVAKGVRRIKEGDLDYGIEVIGDGAFSNLARDINEISEGLKEAVEKELKSERHKTELITNVSHDIRTPLTSIITYVALLKKEGLSSDNAPKYLEILEQKSQRLKTLTDDLFEAAKATSGSIVVEYEKIDISSLLTQGLGELDDKRQESGLDFKITIPNEKVIVKADGKLLWRVIENLLSNAFKYSLPNSRVYIDVKKYEDKGMITVKNVSAYELNIDPDELMERFVRGDESRNSEGSGLGLAIAKSLIELQGGEFDIEIDGDLFKAIIKMPLANI